MQKIFNSIIILTSCFVFSQNKITANFIDSIKLKTDVYLGKDNFENYYHIRNNALHKMGIQKEFQYKNVSLGNLKQVSFENNLQPILLYSDFNTIVVLDNQLNEVKKIEFDTFTPFLKISHIGFGGQNKIWLFDTITQKFGLYDLTTSSFKFISISQNTEIIKLHSSYNFFYYTDTNNNYFKISIFGKKTSLDKLPYSDSFCFLDSSRIIHKQDNKLHIYNLSTSSSIELILNEKSFTNFFFKDGILSIFTQNRIINYQINLP
jgi:hypothetical protein